jgi:dipeptidyl aminopeptidase/acylaminoacyl peptidase
MHRKGRQLGMVVSAALASLLLSSAADAAFPGTNGKLAFGSNRSGQSEIYVSDADGSGRVALGAPGNSPRWSPDGSRIAFGSNRDGNNEIYVMNGDGTGQTRLTDNTTFDSRPQWTADGSQLVFTRIVDGNWEIFRMNADGTDQVDLTNDPALDWSQATSPHGKRVAFTREENGVGHLYLMTTDGKNVQRLTDTNAYDAYPSWSPRGNQILFERDLAPTTAAGSSDLWVVGANGNGETQLTHRAAAEYIVNGAWSPDGTKIVYTTCELVTFGHCTLHTANADGSGDVEISTPTIPYLDTFSGNRIDPFWGIPFSQGGGVSISQTNGELEVSVPSGATLDPSVGYISLGISAQCRLVGDYDVQVDYRLLNWPSPSGVNVDFATNSPDFSDFYGMFVFDPGGGTGISTGFPGPVNTFVRAPESSGTLRLQRTGSTLTASRLVGVGWTPLQSSAATLADQLVNLNVFSNAAPFSHGDVKVAYDNLRVAGGSFACPSWWSDSNADWQPLPGNGK